MRGAPYATEAIVAKAKTVALIVGDMMTVVAVCLKVVLAKVD